MYQGRMAPTCKKVRVLKHGQCCEGLGLSGMRERAEMLGGSLSIERAPGTGTAVQFMVPVGST